MQYPEPESSTVEWKRELTKNEQVIKTVIAFCKEIIKELQWQSEKIDFELLPYHRASKQDLDESTVQYFFNHRKNQAKVKYTEELLFAYSLLVAEHSNIYPTHLALLLFGKQPQKFFTEAMIICSHFKGTSGREAIASVDCEGTLFHQFDQAYAFILSRLYKSFKIKGPKREEELEIPEVAIREALLNALVHRNYHIKAPTKIAIYENRVEIFSPGSFAGPFNPLNLKTGITCLRNPVICKIFREAGYIEKLGSGLIAIFESYQKKELADPQIIDGENYVKVILPRKPLKKSKEKPQLEGELASLFAQAEEISITDVQTTLGVSRATASRKMRAWVKKGKVTCLGKTRSIRYRLK